MALVPRPRCHGSEGDAQSKLQLALRGQAGLCSAIDRPVRLYVAEVCVVAAVCELRMVQKVKDIGAELKLEALAHPEVLHHTHVPGVVPRTIHSIAAESAGAGVVSRCVNRWSREVAGDYATG